MATSFVSWSFLSCCLDLLCLHNYLFVVFGLVVFGFVVFASMLLHITCLCVVCCLYFCRIFCPRLCVLLNICCLSLLSFLSIWCLYSNFANNNHVVRIMIFQSCCWISILHSYVFVVSECVFFCLYVITSKLYVCCLFFDILPYALSCVVFLLEHVCLSLLFLFAVVLFCVLLQVKRRLFVFVSHLI